MQTNETDATLQVRAIRQDDAAVVRDLIETVMDAEFAAEHQAYTCHDLQDPIRFYGGQNDIFLVAEKDGHVIGTVAIKEEKPDTALLRRIFVRQEYRGRGYGTKLLKAALKFCFDHNYHTVNFRVSSRMQQALRLCMQEGFQERGRIPGTDIKLYLLVKTLKA